MHYLYQSYDRDVNRDPFSWAGDSFITFLFYAWTHHYFLFAVLGYATVRGCEYIMMVAAVPVFFHFLVGLGFVIQEIANANLFFSRRALVGNIRGKHLFFLGFINAFGYFVPTLYLIQRKGQSPSWLQDFMVKSLAYDFILTTAFSYLLLGRRILKTHRRDLIMPLVLCVLAIYLTDHLKLDPRDPIGIFVPNVAGRKEYATADAYMYLMSRICYSFVNVGSKLFLFKEQGIQKAWSHLSDQKHLANMKKEVDEWAAREGYNPDIEQVPASDEMRFAIKTSFFNRKAKELFNFYTFMIKSLHRIDNLRDMGLVQGGSGLNTDGFDACDGLEEQVHFMHELEAFLVLNPRIEDELNEQWRLRLIRFKDVIDKPWSRSYQYIKYKLIEYLNKDLEDLETYVNVFKNREQFLKDFNDDGTVDMESFKVDQIDKTRELNFKDQIYDSFLLSDFVTVGTSQQHTALLVGMLDGIAAFPALIIGGRLTGQVPVGLIVNFKNSLYQLFDSELAVTFVVILGIIGFCFRGFAIYNLHYRMFKVWIHEPNKATFVMILIGAPVCLLFLVYPVLQNLPIITMKINTGLALFMTLFAYYRMIEIENKYKLEAIFKANLATIFPLPKNPLMSAKERKFATRYNYEKQRLQITYCEQVAEEIGIHEFLRLAGEIKAVGNLTPLVLTFNPNVDIREKFDEMYHVRSAEWGGYYPCLKTGQYEFITEDYTDLVLQVCKRKVDLEKEQNGRPEEETRSLYQPSQLGTIKETEEESTKEEITLPPQPIVQPDIQAEPDPIIQKLIGEVFVPDELSLPNSDIGQKPRQTDAVDQVQERVEVIKPEFSIRNQNSRSTTNSKISEITVHRI